MNKVLPILVAAWAAGIAAGQELPQPSPSAPPQISPAQLIITYRCPPPRRAAFRQYLREFGLARFEQWKQDGVFKDYRLLFNWYVDADTWDAMAILNFPASGQMARWKEIEKTNPGGLARDALDLAWPLNTYSTDLVTSGASDQPQDAARSVYFIAAYEGGDFQSFANTYLVPQAKGSIKDGILTSYSVYQNRYPAEKRWQGLIVLEYKDAESFARRPKPPPLRSPSITARVPVIADAMLPR